MFDLFDNTTDINNLWEVCNSFPVLTPGSDKEQKYTDFFQLNPRAFLEFVSLTYNFSSGAIK